jgi:hypothetical protein
MISLTPTTWNILGLGVATAYASLGLAAMLLPHQVAGILGFRAATQGNGKPDVPGMMGFIGARDLSIAGALFVFARDGANQEMGTVILSSMILCVFDVFIVWRNGKRLE